MTACCAGDHVVPPDLDELAGSSFTACPAITHHWATGLAVRPGHWAHLAPAPDGDAAISHLAMTRANWALAAQVLAAVSTALAAIFAWLTARHVKWANEYEWRSRTIEHLKLIRRLITDLVETAHKDVDQTFGLQMRLRGELAVAYAAPLPKCLELDDRWYGKTMTVEELDTLAPAALAEVEAAHSAVWEGRIGRVYLYKAGG